MSIKWTGITFLALIVLMELAHLYKDRHGTARRRLGPLIATLGVLPLLVYASAFAIHFTLLTKPGPGDAFMSAQFQHTPLPQKILELNVEMYRSNHRLTATHPYSSRWYTWPFMGRPIFYWVESNARVYLLGNPAVWWLSTAALIVALTNIVASGLRRIDPILAVLVGAWLMNMLPFIGITRVMFLYHYFTALIWAVLLLAYLVDQSNKQRQVFFAISGIALALFIFFAPLSYGLPLSEPAYHARTWFGSWR